MEQPADKAATVLQLQQQILAMQGFARPAGEPRLRLRLGGVERAFPGETFPTGAVHEFTSVAPADGAATSGFLAGLLGCLMEPGGMCLWVSVRRSIFPPALQAFGIAPERVVFVDAARDRDALWVLEEGLRCSALAAVVGELGGLDFTASRRLQLAVEQSRVTGFVHRFPARGEGTVACVSRWRISPLASWQPGAAPGLGFPRWKVELLRVRNGRPGVWQLEWTRSGFREAPRLAAASPSPTGLRKTA